MTAKAGAPCKRRLYWIDPKGQWTYLRRILLLEFLVAAATMLLTAFVMAFVVIGGVESGGSFYWWRIIAYFLALCAGVAAVLIWLGVRLSHRIYGPAFSLGKTFAENTGTGALLPEVMLRRRDDFHTLADAINHYFRGLKARRDESLIRLRTVDNQLAALGEGLGKDAPERETINALRRAIYEQIQTME